MVVGDGCMVRVVVGRVLVESKVGESGKRFVHVVKGLSPGIYPLLH